uniref:Uncharacterized protein n=1 Tax=Tanacetum cinerariifolium TaxID=118510 RepID=A0A6L2JHM8_TANCI|nr:hypothetical protein [Tanacetum cinerariifolium]
MDVEDVLTHPEENVVAQLLTDEEIIESVIGINKDDIDEEDGESSTMEPPSRNEAIKAAITLNNFLLSYEKTTPEVLTMLRKIRDEIQVGKLISTKNKRQLSHFSRNIHKSFIARFPIKMPPRRNRDINDVYDRIMARMKERLDQFIDQFIDRMNDMMNPKRRGDRDGRRGKCEELEYLFFEGDDSSFDEWGDYGVADDDYEEAPIFDDDQYKDVIKEEEGFVDIYDTNIEAIIDGEENNMEDVVVVANDLYSSKIQTAVSVNFSKTVDSNPQELILLKKGNLVEVSILICKKYQEEYLKVAPIDDKFGFKRIKVQGRVIIKKGNLMQMIQI